MGDIAVNGHGRLTARQSGQAQAQHSRNDSKCRFHRQCPYGAVCTRMFTGFIHEMRK
jgi:hypothetical protein